VIVRRMSSGQAHNVGVRVLVVEGGLPPPLSPSSLLVPVCWARRGGGVLTLRWSSAVRLAAGMAA
jgi:hypothetical protein